MRSSNEINLVGRVIDKLQKVKSWCGETHIQKSCYLIKSIMNVPFESEFVLYKHGPYSFDLNAVLGQMIGQRIVETVSKGNYGASYHLHDLTWDLISRASKVSFEKYEPAIGFVCSRVGRMKVAELEKICTAIYVHLKYGSLNESDQPRKLIELKPHIQIDEANLAFIEARKIMSDSNERVLAH